MGREWAEEKLARHPRVLLWLRIGVEEAKSPYPQRFLAEEWVTVCCDALNPRDVRGKQAGLSLSDGRLKLMDVFYLWFVTGSKTTFDQWPQPKQCYITRERLSQEGEGESQVCHFGTQVLPNPPESSDGSYLNSSGSRRHRAGGLFPAGCWHFAAASTRWCSHTGGGSVSPPPPPPGPGAPRSRHRGSAGPGRRAGTGAGGSCCGFS